MLGAWERVWLEGVISRSYAVSAPADQDASQLNYSCRILGGGGGGGGMGGGVEGGGAGGALASIKFKAWPWVWPCGSGPLYN